MGLMVKHEVESQRHKAVSTDSQFAKDESLRDELSQPAGATLHYLLKLLEVSRTVSGLVPSGIYHG